MSLAVKWYDDEHTIVVATIATDTTWEEYHQSVDWIVTEAAKVAHRIDIIFYDNVGMPRGNPMPHLSRGSGRIVSQSNIYLTIIAGSRGSSGFVRMMLEALAKTFMRMPGNGNNRNNGRALMFMRSLDDALAYIQKDRVRSSSVR